MASCQTTFHHKIASKYLYLPIYKLNIRILSFKLSQGKPLNALKGLPLRSSRDRHKDSKFREKRLKGNAAYVQRIICKFLMNLWRNGSIPLVGCDDLSWAINFFLSKCNNVKCWRRGGREGGGQWLINEGHEGERRVSEKTTWRHNVFFLF